MATKTASKPRTVPAKAFFIGLIFYQFVEGTLRFLVFEYERIGEARTTKFPGGCN